jgi:FkbM family methyltransferase
LKTLLTVSIGLVLGGLIFWLLTGSYPAVAAKLLGTAPDCPWGKVLTSLPDDAMFRVIQQGLEPNLTVKDVDGKLDIELVQSPERSFWIARGESQRWGGKHLLAFLLAEHAWKGRTNPQNAVRAGAIVLDCGAHVGVFTHTALRRGAARVVAIEPDPLNLECLRRNFAQEIACGRVILVPKGVWSSSTILVLSASKLNSGSNSFVKESGGERVEMPVTTIDKLVSELGLSRVDYIKMDIEGSEREALKGAQETLRKYRPRLMIDAYHRPDDPRVLPAIIRRRASVSSRTQCSSSEELDLG